MNEDMHRRFEIADLLTLIGELEHLKRHEQSAGMEFARQAENAETTDDKDKLDNRSAMHLVYAAQCQHVRRQLMRTEEIPEELWCSVKTAAIVKQLAKEVGLGEAIFRDICDMCDNICEDALGVDLSGCASCREDKELGSERADS